jgi:CBS domain-containing protein/sporulation protein YlmC with PRC-barrel domain
MFVYLTEVLGKRVLAAGDRRPLGRPVDFVANAEERFPEVVGFQARAGRGAPFFVPWTRVLAVEQRAILVDAPDAAAFAGERPPDGALWVRRHILDRQIIDTFGARVVRVNDLQFLVAEGELHLVHVDVGASGLFRRLGWLPAVNWLADGLFDYRLRDHLIAWKFVHPLGHFGRGSARQVLRLAAEHRPLAELHPAELAEVLEELDAHKRQAIFHTLDPETAADALQEMDTETQVDLIEGMHEERATRVVEEMAADDAADLLSELEEEKAASILEGMETERSIEVRELLTHEEDTAGALMTTDFIALKVDYTVDQTIAVLREEARDAESVYYLFVLDDLGRLVGVVTLRGLIVAGPATRLGDIMSTRVVSVRVDEGTQAAAELFAKYRFRCLPVLDAAGVMKGIITVDDVLAAVAPELSR